VPRADVEQAADLMHRFMDRTGLTSSHPPRRYLWTDAFAVCNLLELGRLTGDDRYRALALDLVDQVHHTLGRHRADDSRTGWISGLDARTAEAHPTAGGLRIGKPRPERGPGEPLDNRHEWDRDGQYFHYLTKWMHALDQLSRATGEPRWNGWARELARVAERAFGYRPPSGGRRLRWKMSIDLSRPLVPSSGQHDPLDGLVTAIQLDATAVRLGGEPELGEVVAALGAMIDPHGLATGDPLGLGGLLADARRIAQLMRRGAWPSGDRLLAAVIDAVVDGLDHLEPGPARAENRLAFRELGLAIGLAGIDGLRADVAALDLGAGVHAGLQALARQAPIGAALLAFWSQPEPRASRTWHEHVDIDDVMLATSLIPAGVLALG